MVKAPAIFIKGYDAGDFFSAATKSSSCATVNN